MPKICLTCQKEYLVPSLAEGICWTCYRNNG